MESLIIMERVALVLFGISITNCEKEISVVA